jgi:hypothetical protein
MIAAAGSISTPIRAARGQQHPGRAGAGVHHPGRADPGPRRPGDHALDDRRRGERLPEHPPARRAAQRAEGVPERVLPGPDPVPGRRHRADAPEPTLARAGRQVPLRAGPAGHGARAQPAGQGHQRLLVRYLIVWSWLACCGAPRENAGHPPHCDVGARGPACDGPHRRLAAWVVVNHLAGRPVRVAARLRTTRSSAAGAHSAPSGISQFRGVKKGEQEQREKSDPIHRAGWVFPYVSRVKGNDRVVE